MAYMSGCKMTDTQVAGRPRVGTWLVSQLVRSLVPLCIAGEQMAGGWICGGQVNGA